MSIAERVMEQGKRIESLFSKTRDSLQNSKTGEKLLEASNLMNSSSEMQLLQSLLANKEIGEEERVILARHMGDAMRSDPENGLIKFAESLEKMAEDNKYSNRKEYYTSVANACRNLNDTDGYKEYVKMDRKFKKDKSPEANEARKMVDLIQKKSQEIIRG